MLQRLSRIAGSLVLAGIAVAPCQAHFHILLPQSPAAKSGGAVRLTYAWGHPFEHQLFDTESPRAWFVLTPNGAKEELMPASKKVGAGGQAAAYEASFSPKARGDYTCVVECQPVWMAEDEEFLADAARVAVHVQAQKGWDARTGLPLDLVPLTRPYGLEAGTVFQAQALADGKPLAGSLVEIERYNATPPKQIPAEEHITRTAKTDPNGVVTASLPEAGWWCLTVARPAGVKERAGKNYPLRQRATLWVYVDERRRAEGK